MSSPAHHIENIKRNIRGGSDEDYIMPIWLALLPYIIGVIGGAIFFFSLFAMLSAIGMGPQQGPGMVGGPLALSGLMLIILIIGTILQLYVIYKFIDRRNRHIKRTLMLYEDLAALLESLGYTDAASRIRTSIREKSFEVGGEKNAILWVVLFIIFNPVVLYIFHFLNKDFRRHSIYEDRILSELNAVLRDEGVKMIDTRRILTIPERSTILYIILTIVTLGFFFIYWVYVMAKDPNEHFLVHRELDMALIQSLEELLEKREKTI